MYSDEGRQQQHWAKKSSILVLGTIWTPLLLLQLPELYLTRCLQSPCTLTKHYYDENVFPAEIVTVPSPACALETVQRVGASCRSVMREVHRQCPRFTSAVSITTDQTALREKQNRNTEHLVPFWPILCYKIAIYVVEFNT